MQRAFYQPPSITEIGKIATYTLGAGGSCKDGTYIDKSGKVCCKPPKRVSKSFKSSKSFKAPKRKKW